MRNLNEMERSVLTRNLLNHSQAQADYLPVLPVTRELINSLTGYILKTDYGVLDGLKCLAVESRLISTRLQELAPIKPFDDSELEKPLSLDNLPIKCLHSAIIGELVHSFNQLADIAEMRASELMRGTTGGSYDTIN